MVKYSVDGTSQVGKSKLQITCDETNHKWVKATSDFFLSQVICNFDFPTFEVPSNILYDCAIINHKKIHQFHKELQKWVTIKLKIH